MKQKRILQYIIHKFLLAFSLYGVILGGVFLYDSLQWQWYTILIDSFRSDTLTFNQQLRQIVKGTLQYDYSSYPVAPSFRNVLQGVSIVESLPMKTIHDYKTTGLVFSGAMTYIHDIIRNYPFLEGVVGYKKFLESYDIWLSQYETFILRWNYIKKQHTYCMLFPWYHVVLRFFPREFL